MSHNDLPEFGDKYLQFFDPIRRQFQLRRRSRSEGYLSIAEAMEMLDLLMKKHQLSFVPNKANPKLILLPFAFVEPREGDKIRNHSTNEIYTVDQIIKNPTTNQWNGIIKLDLVTPPSIEHRHSLEYLDPSRYVKFEHVYPDSILNILGANSEGVPKNIPPIAPTVTWTLNTVEPGGIGKPFDSRKQYKPVLRESTKDPYAPGYTVEVYGKWLDNIVQFDAWSNDFRTSERLITWFEQLLQLYAGYLQQKGIPNLFFWQRPEEKNNTAWRQMFPVKSTQFYFRTEELEAVYQRDILKIDISLGASETIAYDNQFKYIAGQLVSGQYTPDEYRALFYRSGEYLFGDLDIRQ